MQPTNAGLLQFGANCGSVALTIKMHISGEQECQSLKQDGFILPAHKIALPKDI